MLMSGVRRGQCVFFSSRRTVDDAAEAVTEEDIEASMAAAAKAGGTSGILWGLLQDGLGKGGQL
jgi:hypothetical protein